MFGLAFINTKIQNKFIKSVNIFTINDLQIIMFQNIIKKKDSFENGRGANIN